MNCQRCDAPKAGRLNTSAGTFFICANCSDELYQKLLDNLPTITDSTLPLSERLEIRRERSRKYVMEARR